MISRRKAKEVINIAWFGHTNLLLFNKQKRTFNRHFSRPAETDPYTLHKCECFDNFLKNHIYRGGYLFNFSEPYRQLDIWTEQQTGVNIWTTFQRTMYKVGHLDNFLQNLPGLDILTTFQSSRWGYFIVYRSLGALRAPTSRF